MSRIRKRFARMMNNPNDIKWDELQTVLKNLGLICVPPAGGSHWTVYHPAFNINITVPVHRNRVKSIYVKKLIQLLEDISAEMDEEE